MEQTQTIKVDVQYSVSENAQVILMDVSWDQSKRAEITYTRFRGNDALMEIYCKGFRAEDPSVRKQIPC
jgi:hypothetical protein